MIFNSESRYIQHFETLPYISYTVGTHGIISHTLDEEVGRSPAAPVAVEAMASGPAQSAVATWPIALAASLECAVSVVGRTGAEVVPATTRIP